MSECSGRVVMYDCCAVVVPVLVVVVLVIALVLSCNIGRKMRIK